MAGAAPIDAEAPAAGDEDAPAEFSDQFLGDGGVLRKGKKIWGKTCKLCHGNTAYPGKAPKLNKKCYEADFIYDRVTNGFQAMPAWKSQIEKYDRMAVVTDTSWVRHSVKAFGWLIPGEVKVYPYDQLVEATAWVTT